MDTAKSIDDGDETNNVSQSENEVEQSESIENENDIKEVNKNEVVPELPVELKIPAVDIDSHENNNIDQNEIKSKTEFTYTSLTSFEDLNGQTSQIAAEQAKTNLQKQINHSISVDNENKNDADRQNLEKILEKLKTNQITNKEVVNFILNLLVGGEFDLEKNFIIKHVNNILYMMQIIKCANSSLKAEIWSLFTAILRKSQRNLQACVDVGLIEAALHELKDADSVCADLIVEMLTVLASYSVTVDELKSIFNALKCEDKAWKRNSIKLFNVLKAMPHRVGPDEFFSLPGRRASGISLPPIRNWPYQNGFTFSTWFRIDPVSGVNIEKEKPYLYWFGTSKGLGYMAHFMGSCLVLQYCKQVGKEFQHCIQYDFKPREWYMITICHVYNRWSKSTIHCYINGKLFSQTAISFHVETQDVFDKCFLGCTSDPNNEMTLFSGQLSTIYLFNQWLDANIIESMYLLGPGYKNQFRNENECSYLHLNKRYRKLLYDGKLTNSIVFMYNAVNCDSQLLLQSAPKLNQATQNQSSTSTTTQQNALVHNHFVHSSHALMLNDVKAVKTNSIYSTLLSIGGVQVFYLLFNQLDCKQLDSSIDYNVCSTLIQIICDMIESSYTVQIQMINTKGFLAISYALEKSSRNHINEKVLNSIIKLIKFLVRLENPNGTILLKQLLDHIIFNPSIWIYCSVQVQTQLYSYLATEFVNDVDVYNNIRRISAVIQTVHALKYYYWIINPRDRSGFEPKAIENQRPNVQNICSLRAYMILYIKELILKENGVQDDELQALLNYLHTVHEDDNLLDVLKLVVTLMNEHPPSMIPAFDRKLGIRTVFKLLASSSETIRLKTLKLLGFFLQKCTAKRKADAMNVHNLFSLLTDRLLLYQNEFSMSIYNTLYEILVERTVMQVVENRHPDPDSSHRIENSPIIKVIATLLRSDQTKNMQLIAIKKQFLSDLIHLCKHSRENRRIVLQMSVWQEFLIALAYIHPNDDDEIEITNLVFELFKILLYHAIKFEYGGWRVWIDTLSIFHSRVSKEEYQLKMNHLYEEYEKTRSNSILNQTEQSNKDNHQPLQLPPFRIPEFKWSHVHKRLLNDILGCIENEIQQWKRDNQIRTLSDSINHVDNGIFCVNTIHIISQLADILTNACGGLLPLLASATSNNASDIEILENTEGITSEEGSQFLERVMRISDLIILSNNSSFSDLEQEKNMPNGAIIRQTLRLTFTYAVKNCLDFRKRLNNPHSRSNSFSNTPLNLYLDDAKKISTKDPVEALLEAQLQDENSKSDKQKTIESLLQDIDIYRLKALLYRDVVRNERNKSKPIVSVDDSKQCQYIALSIVYFISVLMVSRYRDIIENNQLTTSVSTASAPTASDGQTHVVTPKMLNRSARVAAQINAAHEKQFGNNSRSSISDNDDEKSLDHYSNGIGGVNGGGGDGSNISANGIYNDESDESGAIKSMKEINLDDGSVVQSDSNTNYSNDNLPISSIQVNNSASSKAPTMEQQKLPDYPKTANSNNAELLSKSNISITEKLEKALTSVAPFLKDIFTEFSHLLSKVIVGSHGQELITSGLFALKQTSSVIELVMLLCSQEWQTSLQKHAGLSFIELVNEGRLLSHASKDHIVRVANEADFILNRLRAEDVKKHAEFEQSCAQTSLERKEEEGICEHLITSARKRDYYYAIKLRDKILNLITDKQGCWHDAKTDIQIYWKLDSWEDDTRRRRRLIKNPNGSPHSEATLAIKQLSDDEYGEQDAFNNKDDLHKQLINNQKQVSLPIEDEQFDEKELEQEYNGPIHYTTKCKLVSPVCTVSGTLSITANELYFEVNEDDETYKSLDNGLLSYTEYLHGKWHFNEIRAVFSRRYLLQNVAVEIFTANRSSVMFAFSDRQTVKKVINILPRVGAGPRYGLPIDRRTSLASPQQLFRSSNMTQKWQRREITNFEYLMYLNTISGRTYNDLNQYFIFPWVLVNYDSPTIDLNSPTSYRDLSKPIGALNPSRKQVFVDRFQNWDNSTIPAFHYGTHYSTAAFTLNWLLRLEPFTTIFLNLQGGKFDHADRTFHSLSISWKNCQRDTSDVKELIPEFYYLPEMFLNLNKYNLGVTQDKLKIDDVELPKWAPNAYEFVRINRQALESEFVSCQLHQWIDLIFGYKQRGPEAIRACNVFYYLTYEGAVNLEQVDDIIMKQAIESQIKNFGQTPSQLLTEPHPPRSSAMTVSPMMFTAPNEDISMMMKFLSNAPIIYVSANTFPSLSLQAIVTISSKHEFSVNKYNPSAAQSNQQFNNNVYAEAAAAAAGSGSTPTTPQQTSPPMTPTLPTNTPPQAQTTQAQSSQQIAQLLPLQMDPLLVFGTGLHKRQLGDNFDDKLQLNHNNFIVTYDNRYILATGFWDKSFRVFSTETGKLVQIIYGHYDLVTCITRSEMTQNGNCFIATGSRDSTIMIWIWNGTKGYIVNKDLSVPNLDDNPGPGAILTGHSKQIVSILVSSELGIVVSGSEQGPILVHTVYGELLRQFEQNSELYYDPSLLYMSQDAENICVLYKTNYLCLYTLNGKQLNQIQLDDRILAITMSQDGQYIIIGGEKGTVYVYKTHDLSLVYTYPTCDTSIRSLALTYDQRFIIVGLSTGCLLVFNINFNVISYRKRNY